LRRLNLGRWLLLTALILLSILRAPSVLIQTAHANGCPVTICWYSSLTGGYWEVPAHWNLGRVPIASDDVAIIGGNGFTVTLNSSQTVHSLYIGGSPILQCTSACSLTILAHTPAWTYDLAYNDVINIAGNVINHAGFLVNHGTINILAGGTFVNHNKLDFSAAGSVVTNNGVFDEKCGASVVGSVPGNVVTESPCPTQVSTALGSQVSGTVSFSSELGAFTSITATALSSVSPAPPAGLTFPDGLFSFTISGLRIGQTVTVTITLPSPLPSGSFSYWKFHSGIWQQVPAGQVSLDSTRTIITLTLTDGNSPDDADGSPNGVIVDPGGPATITCHTASCALQQGGYRDAPRSLVIETKDSS
jgi:hypothetical protein